MSNRGDVERDISVTEWLRHYAGSVRMSVVTVAEMHRGLLLLEANVSGLADRRVKAREQRRLTSKRAWYHEVTTRFADRIEPIDVPVAEKWAEISVRFPSLRDADKVIAATAIAKGLGVATENVGDFRQSGVILVNPFDPGTRTDDWDDDPIAAILRR